MHAEFRQLRDGSIVCHQYYARPVSLLAAAMSILLRVLILIAFVAAACAAELESVEVEGTAFKVTLSDGRVLRSPDLVDATLTMTLGGQSARVRIDAVERDPDAVGGEVYLHTFSVAAADGTRQNLCDAGPGGRRQGFPIPGRPRPSDGMFEPAEPGTFDLTCTSGGRGKCVRFGYRPWESAQAADLFNACVRMLRADYCGDATPTTRDGTLIDVYDDLGIQKRDDDPNLAFEAAWSANGAVCVRRVRIEENISLETLVAACPRLKDRVGDMCTEEKARALGAKLFNRSKP